MAKVPNWFPAAAATVVLVGSGIAATALTSGSSPSDPAGFQFAEETTSTPSTEPVTTVPEPDGSEVPVDDTSGDAGDTLRYWGPECGDNPTNHGGYVARAEKNGVSRREAAHSPCGKPLTSIHTTTPTTTTTTTTAEPPAPVPDAPITTQAPAPTSGHAPPSHGNGGGNGNGGGPGNGHGNGNGH